MGQEMNLAKAVLLPGKGVVQILTINVGSEVNRAKPVHPSGKGVEKLETVSQPENL